jgi:hypothetical protein
MEIGETDTNQKTGRKIVMFDNENLVTEVTENVEQTTEETPKMFTQDEVNDIVGKAKARERAKITKQKDREYGVLMETLRAGTGKESVEDINDAFSKFYESKGIKIRKEPQYSAKDIETLAKAEAEEIIHNGYEDVVDEVDRLAEIGVDKMSAREKALFEALAKHRATAERNKELSTIGITEEVYNSKEFKEFSSQFNSNVPISKVYDLYNKTQPKKEIRTAGSMKHNTVENGVKDFYTPEEIARLTMKDLDDPNVWKAVRRSMTGG